MCYAYFAAVEYDRAGQADVGLVTVEDLADDVKRLTASDPQWRVINLTAIPRRQKFAVGPEIFERTTQALWRIAIPHDLLLTVIETAQDNPRDPAIWLLLEADGDVSAITAAAVPRTAEALATTDATRAAFLVQLPPDAATMDVAQLIQQLKGMLVGGSPNTPRPLSRDPELSTLRNRALVAPPSPEQAAQLRRSVLMGRAREEHWPESDGLAHALGADTPEAAAALAAQERQAGRLLGIWTGGRHASFVHPHFQFLPNGRLHPRLPDLLSALGRLPTFLPEDDRSGWGRLNWLIQPRHVLSERSIAEAAPARVAGDHSEASLDDHARTPAEVFLHEPDAVIALAYEDAEVACAAL